MVLPVSFIGVILVTAKINLFRYLPVLQTQILIREPLTTAQTFFCNNSIYYYLLNQSIILSIILILLPRYGGVTKKPTEINYAMISVVFRDQAVVLLW
jgi:hypothetical protein